MKIKIDNYSMQPSRFIAGTKGSYGFDFIDIEFGEDWEGLSKKIVFSPPEGDPVSVVWAGDPVPIPAEVMAVRGKTGFAVVGYENEKTKITVTGELDVLNTLDPDGIETVPPTENEVAQIMKYMEQAVSAAESVREDADNGVFNGNGWLMGTALSGKGHDIAADIPISGVGDFYFNTDTYETYHCTAKGLWSYMGTLKGTGAAAGWGTPTAEIHMVDDNAQPTVKISASGEDTAKVLSFSFGIPASYTLGGGGATPKKYSVRFPDGGVQGVREDAAEGMVAEVAVGDATVRNDFDGVSFYNRRICNGIWNELRGKWEIIYYLGDQYFSWTSSDYEVLYECTPFYISDDTDINNYVSVCGSPCDGYSLAPMFKNGHDKVYLPCFETYLKENTDGTYKPRSTAGVIPTCMPYITFCKNIGTYNAKAFGEPVEVFYSETVLQLVEFATKDLGSVMKGVSGLAYGDSTDKVIARKDNYNFTVSAATAAKLTAGQTFSISSDSYQSSLIHDNIFINSITYSADGSIATVNTNQYLSTAVAGKYINSRMFKTGVAAQAVTGASSGSATSNTDGKSPCIWRGKENPWGNGRNMLGNAYSARMYSSILEDYFNDPCYVYNPETNRSGSMASAKKSSSYMLPGVSGSVTAFSSDNGRMCMTLPSEVGEETETGPYFITDNSVYSRCLSVGGGFANSGRCGLCVDVSVLMDRTYHDTCFRYYMEQG